MFEAWRSALDSLLRDRLRRRRYPLALLGQHCPTVQYIGSDAPGHRCQNPGGWASHPEQPVDTLTWLNKRPDPLVHSHLAHIHFPCGSDVGNLQDSLTYAALRGLVREAMSCPQRSIDSLAPVHRLPAIWLLCCRLLRVDVRLPSSRFGLATRPRWIMKRLR